VAVGDGGLRALLAYIILVFAALTFSDAVAAKTAKPGPVTAQIERADGKWSVEFRLGAKHKIWAFARSKPDNALGRSWRGRSWIVETKGVRLSRRGGYDVLIADGDFVPPKVKINFNPWPDDLRADYHPALLFSENNIALFDAHFNILPYDPDRGLGQLDAPQVNRFTDKGQSVWVDGKAHSSVSLSGNPTYVLFGDLRPTETERLESIIDPTMPMWLQNSLKDFLPKLIDDFTDKFGVGGLDRRPVIWAVWGGAAMQGITTEGSVLPGFITAVLEGNRFVNESSVGKERVYWFLAHEAAHFWLGQRANYAGNGHQWIAEGGANAAAMLHLKATLPDYDYDREFAEQETNCRKSAKLGAIRNGHKIGDYDGYYACGALFNLVAHNVAAKNGGDFFSFNGALIKQADASDKMISGEEWLDAFRAIAKDSQLPDAMVRLLEGTSKDVDKDIDLIVAQAKLVSTQPGSRKL
jgi:hypothetical protein